MENLISLAHKGEIRSLSTAVWRPYAVTVGEDRCIFLWNVAGEQIQFRRQLEEDVLSASLHPMGHYVAVTTSDSLQVFSVLVDRFHLVREVILAGCRKLAFNSGGNYIAVTRGATLQLINFITFETSSPLMAHKAEVLIQKLILDVIWCGNICLKFRSTKSFGAKMVNESIPVVLTDFYANGTRLVTK